MQQQDKQLPRFLNTDVSLENMLPEESIFMKGVESSINGNPELGNGSNNTMQEGQNCLSLTPSRSNVAVPDVLLPGGYNKNIGSFESILTQENYSFNYNSEGQFGIYILDGNTGLWTKVIEDPSLQFTDDHEHFIASHRVRLWIVNDKDGNIRAKYLLLTDGNSWQKWINAIAALKTNGFDASLYPYWALLPPHFDRRELVEWAVRPPMYNPQVITIKNIDADKIKVNRLVDQGFQFAIVFNMTDGRTTSLSPYSLPLIIKSEDFLNSPDVLSKNALLTLYAGSCMVESIDLYVRKTAKNTYGIASTVSWGAWFKYDRINKYTNCGINDLEVIGTDYWLRSGAWEGMEYDPVFNTIKYTFDNSKLADIPVIDTVALQNDLPQTSHGFTDMGNAALLGNNRYGYDNFSCRITGNLDAVVVEKTNAVCPVPLRKIRLYAYVARCQDDFAYISQVGYYVGQDTTIRFGSTSNGPGEVATFAVSESKQFDLDFADKRGFRCYLKGTPYYADGTWYQVNNDNSLVKIVDPLDFSNSDVLTFVQNVYTSLGYFVCVFDLIVPAGRYVATLGRHNVASSGDYRNTSTYIEGIANSRSATPFINIRVVRPTAIVTYSKEMELDCTNNDIDVWGNGQDLFYVYCPYRTNNGNKRFRFIEGYLEESPSSPLGVEFFPYTLSGRAADDSGTYTDHNGFYFAYTKAANSNVEDIKFTGNINCAPSSFVVPTSQSGSGWRPNPPAYLSDHNGGVIGDCNRVLYTGKITSLDGTINYSNVAINIVDGTTVLTKSDGTFELVIHNGLNVIRSSNVYVNAGGNFLITISNCGQVPLFHYNESLVACTNCNKRVYPIPLILGVNAQGGTQYSVKEYGAYSIGIVAADLAGRLTFVNVIKDTTVPSFLVRNDTLATFFRLLVNGPLNFDPDMKWFAPYVSPQLNIQKYIQWVGDSIQYIDNNGGVVSDVASAVFCSISIQSLYNNNVSRNFSLLASYQFTPEDRLRILDDGNGQLFDIAGFGDPLDLQILGTNYNQAAMAAGIIPNTNTNPTINNNVTNTTTVNTADTPSITTIATVQNSINITFYVRYDARLDNIIGNTGFWIEIYTPSQQSAETEIPFNELEWKPIVNGEIADFGGYSNGQPFYNYPTSIDINFWDTYLFSRNITIPLVGDKFFSHPFESPNISDTFGANITSGGRQLTKNDDAKQLIYKDDVIRSNAFITGGTVNGLGTFSSANRKDFSKNNFGGILALISTGNIILFVCENDWFTTTFDYHFTYPNAQGVMVVNLDNGLSTPSQKVGDIYGMAAEDTGTLIIYDKFVFWYDRKNEAYVICNYSSANDISDITDQEGRKFGIKAFLTKKTQFITNWNLTHDKSSRFDVICGIDIPRKNIYLTFRPRRQNTNDLSSYVNQRRNWQLGYQETVRYSIDSKRWIPCANFTPESFGTIMGNATGLEMITYAAGKPYTHNKGNVSFLTFYGQLTEPVLMVNFNKQIEAVKILQSISFDCNLSFLIDLIYSDEPFSFSYLGSNYFKRKENLYYSQVLRNMVSYPNPKPELLFQSTLLDGKRVFGTFFICRFVGTGGDQYFQLVDLFYLFTFSQPIKK